MNFKSFVLLTVVSMLASPLCHAQVEVRPVGITINSAETLYNKTLDGATTVFNGSSTQNFSVATLTVGNISGTFVQAYLSAAAVTMATNTATIATFATEVPGTDANNEFNHTTGAFVPLVSGVYRVSGQAAWILEVTGMTTYGATSVSVYKNGSDTGFRAVEWFREATTNFSVAVHRAYQNYTFDVPLSAGDTLTIRYLVDAAGMTQNPQCAAYQDTMMSIVKVR